MDDIEDISEKELEKISTDLLKRISSILPKLVGENLDIKITKDDKESTKEVFRYFMDKSKEKTRLDRLTLPADTKLKQGMQFAENLIAELMGTETENPISEIVSAYNLKQTYMTYNSDKKYAEQAHKNMQEIMNKIMNNGISEKFDEFLQTLDDTSAYALFQFAVRIAKTEKDMLKEREYFSQKITEKYIGYYKDVSTCVDLLIPIVYGVKLLSDNKYKTVAEIRKNPNGNLLKELEKDPLFADLIKPYDLHIRNAFAHGTNFIDPVKKKIVLKDKKKESVMTFKEFVIHVQQILGMLSVLSRVKHEMSLARFKVFEFEKKKLFE